MKRFLFLNLLLLMGMTISAAEQFVVFKASADVLPLQGASISFDAKSIVVCNGPSPISSRTLNV